MRGLTLSALILIAACLGHAAEPRGAQTGRTVTAEQLQPASHAHSKFRAVEDDQPPLQITVEACPTGANRWLLRRPDLATDVMQQQDGEWVLIEARVDRKNSRLVFDPPARLLPAELERGRPVEQEGRLRVFDLKKNTSRTTGRYKRQIEFIDERIYDIPAGRQEAILVRTTEEYRFTGANVRIVTDRAYRPGAGMIYEQSRETVRTLGIFSETSSLTLELSADWRPGNGAGCP